jgi:hypothetical protein
VIQLLKLRLSASRYLAMAALTILCACGQAATPQKPASVEPALEEPTSLALEGYNYTNRYIDSFTVDGQGGGNIHLSSPTSGGGGTVCCVPYWLGTKTNVVAVRWQSGACYYHKRSSTSYEVYERLHSFYTERKVTVLENNKQPAKYMEVHFYADGSVQAAVTASASPPRMQLSEERKDSSKYPRCPNDEKPAE